MTADDFRRVAQVLQTTTQRYAGIADGMGEANVDSLPVPRVQSLKQGLERLRAHVTAAISAFDSHLMSSLPDDESGGTKPSRKSGRPKKGKERVPSKDETAQKLAKILRQAEEAIDEKRATERKEGQ